MNRSSLREICAKATPGPWKTTGETVVIELPSTTLHYNARLLCHMADWPDSDANAQLIARFSPETALAVYEALENSERVLRGAALNIEDFSPYKSESAALKAVLEQADKVKAALRLLDGRTEP